MWPAPPFPVRRGRPNRQARLRRGFTLTELIVVVIVLSIVAATAIASYTGIFDRATDDGPVQALEALSVSQYNHHQLRGSFVDAPAALERLEKAYDYEPGGNRSRGPKNVSVAAESAAGVDVVGMAVLSDSGACYLVRVEEPTSPVDDVRVRLDADTDLACSGTTALVVGPADGEGW